MCNLFPVDWSNDFRTMAFIDGENLAIRFKNQMMEKKIKTFPEHVRQYRDVYVWSRHFLNSMMKRRVIRRYYFSSISGDTDKMNQVCDELKELGIESPMLFKKEDGKRSKRVDISLTTEVLFHTMRRNIDAVILVAGDEDYVPLVSTIRREGCRVILWFIENGLSPALRREADYFADIEQVFLSKMPVYD